MTITQAETVPGYVAGTWTIDPLHSEVGFSVRHMMVSKVRGKFTKFSGELVTAENPLESSVAAEIDLSSIETGAEQRDGHLRSPDFFDTENHPVMTFRSTGIRAKGDGYVVDGELTLKGVTKNVPLELEINGFGPDAYGGTRAGRLSCRPNQATARLIRALAAAMPLPDLLAKPDPGSVGPLPGSSLEPGHILAVLPEVVEVERAQCVGDVGVVGVEGVPDQRGQVERVGLGMIRMAGDRLSGRQLAKQVPEERHVEMMQCPPDRQVVQFPRGQGIKIVLIAHDSHPNSPPACHAQPRSRAPSRRPSGGEPRSSRALWNRSSEKPDPQAARARSRSAMISSFPHV